jgi:ABC-2 type transport system ATP-binding protein
VASLTAWLAERQVPLDDLRAGRQSLEDVFLRLTAEGGGPPPLDDGTAMDGAQTGADRKGGGLE